MIIASQGNYVLLVDLVKKTQVDLGAELDIGNVKAISSFHGYFYIIFNKLGNNLGYFLLKISEKKPLKDYVYLIKWVNKLDISDAGIHVL